MCGATMAGSDELEDTLRSVPAKSRSLSQADHTELIPSMEWPVPQLTSLLSPKMQPLPNPSSTREPLAPAPACSPAITRSRFSITQTLTCYLMLQMGSLVGE